MGAALTYLPEPITERDTIDGEIVGRARFGACGVQGWRRRMEDAHLVVPDLDGSSKFSLFGVFDGHGGRGVSRFAAKRLPDLLRSKEKELADGRYGEALRDAFFEVDRELLTSAGKKEVERLDKRTKDEPRSRRIPCRIPKRVLASRMQAAENGDDDRPVQASGEGEAEVDAEEGEEEEVCVGEDDLEEAEEEMLEGEGDNLALLDPGADPTEEPDREQAGEEDEPDEAAEDEEEEEMAMVAIDPDTVLMNSTPDAQGCTAVVTLIDWSGATGPGVAGARVVVANAGDSRCILSTRKKAEESKAEKVGAIALSEDHKPELKTEKARIEAAGGEVKDMPGGARVQGDLNLSRALGDLRYKKRDDLPPSAQIVTADPEIREHTLTVDDQLLILGCDGIWERNENDTLSEKLSARRQRAKDAELSSLCGEVCDWTLCADMEGESEHDGTGCDNMTILIVEMLQPSSDENGGEPPAKRARQDCA
mmetsp:Transcript_24645/g.56901  ORF Transcript_24645/g.56901 Transcript_24645/m.56901 type:complete len:480 (-) Transcript_24645:12-1451(-)